MDDGIALLAEATLHSKDERLKVDAGSELRHGAAAVPCPAKGGGRA